MKKSITLREFLAEINENFKDLDRDIIVSLNITGNPWNETAGKSISTRKIKSLDYILKEV